MGKKNKIINKRLYYIWNGMKQRCFNKNHSNWNNYGRKGITVCQEWLSFANFYNWAIEHGYSDNLTIDRIDYRGNYEPDNCQWITRKLNSHRTANEPDKKYMCVETGKIYIMITDAAKSVGISPGSVYNSINKKVKVKGYSFVCV